MRYALLPVFWTLWAILTPASHAARVPTGDSACDEAATELTWPQVFQKPLTRWKRPQNIRAATLEIVTDNEAVAALTEVIRLAETVRGEPIFEEIFEMLYDCLGRKAFVSLIWSPRELLGGKSLGQYAQENQIEIALDYFKVAASITNR